jgi:hypothetical protein
MKKASVPTIRNPCLVLAAGTTRQAIGFVYRRSASNANERRRPTIRSLNGWAISVLYETNAIRECEEHGWVRDRSDPHARERAFDIARLDPPPEFHPKPLLSLLWRCWFQLATPAPNARRRIEKNARHSFECACCCDRLESWNSAWVPSFRLIRSHRKADAELIVVGPHQS